MPRRIEPFFLVAMDPGEHTGLSIMHVTADSYKLIDRAVVRYAPDRRSNPVIVLREWKKKFTNAPQRFVYENFHVRPEKFVPNTDALKVIGATDLWIMDENPYTEIFKREPVAGKHMITDEILEKTGLFLNENADSRHVNDALRHSSVYLHRITHMPFCLVAWPPT